MLWPRDRAVAVVCSLWVGVIVLALLAACASPMPEPDPGPTPVAALIAPSGREIAPADAGVLTCLAHWGNEPVYRLAWSPDQRIIGVASFAGAYLYDSKMLKQIRFIQDPVMIGMPSVRFSPDGTLLASGSWDGTVRLWRVSDGSLVNVFDAHTSQVESVDLNPNGTLLAVSGATDKTVRLLRVSDGSLVRAIHGDEAHMVSASFSPDGSLLAVGSLDGTIDLWGVAR